MMQVGDSALQLALVNDYSADSYLVGDVYVMMYVLWL